jgi:hypothetical protein
LNTEAGEISPEPGKQLKAPRTQDVYDLLVIETSWPGTTIDGKPGIASGMLSVSGSGGRPDAPRRTSKLRSVCPVRRQHSA